MTEQLQPKEPRLHWSALLALVLGVLGLTIAACNYPTEEIIPTAQANEPPFTPTLSLDQTESPTPSPEAPLYIPPGIFAIGQENLVSLNQPFTVNLPLNTAVSLTWGESKNFHMDLPLLATENYWIPTQLLAFNENGADNSEGNMLIWVPTSDPNHFMAIVHSGNASSIGKTVFMAGYIDSIDQSNDFFNNPIKFSFAEADLSGQAIHIATIPTESFYNPANWADDNPNVPMYARLAQLGFPPDLLTSPENTYRLTFVGCQSKIPGKPSLLESINAFDASANQSLMTVEFALP